MNGLTIRDANSDDINLLANMHLKSRQQNYSYFMPAEYFEAVNVERFVRFWTKAFENKSYKHKAWIAEVASRPIGFCNAALAHYYPEGYPGHLDNIHLLDGCTSKGIGKKMFSVCENYFFNELNTDGFYLVVYQKHIKARKFYEAIGGKELSFREHNIINSELAFTYISYGWKK